MNMRKNIAIFIIFAIIIGGAGYYALKNSKQASKDSQSAKFKVSTSFYPLYFFATEIGGDKADVSNIIPYGAEPHDYEPTAKDMAEMEKSDLIILNGGGLESWSEDIQKNINSEKTLIVSASEGLATKQMTEGGETETDPHVWLAPKLAEGMVDNIEQGFSSADPKNKDYYKSNADSLKSKLAALDESYRHSLSNCAKKNIVTSHDAFGYLAAAYGFEQVPIAGLSPDAEPSPKQLAGIAEFAMKNGVRYIFFESLASPKLSETIASEIGAKTLVLNPLEGLSKEESARGKNYLTVMQDNLINLKTALECQ